MERLDFRVFLAAPAGLTNTARRVFVTFACTCSSLRGITNRCIANSGSAAFHNVGNDVSFTSRALRYRRPARRVSVTVRKIDPVRGEPGKVVEIDESGRRDRREGGNVPGDLDAVGVMTVAGAAGQTTGSGGLVGGAIAPGATAGRCPGRSLGRVRAVRAALPLDDALLGLGGPLRTAAVRVRAGGAARAGVGVRIAVLLLGGPHPAVRIVADHVVARRLRIRG